jgi:peptide methionine sulfoxide reductase msrA/msrB
MQNLSKLSKTIFALLMIFSINGVLMAEKKEWKKLTPEEKRVIIDKGTERPFTGQYTDYKGDGTYNCKQCGTALYKSSDKFDSHCGWPSFDDEIKGKVIRVKDSDGQRTEIVCANCKAHLGHIFTGEGLTDKDTRHCVNSISLEFVPAVEHKDEYAIFAGGCFWGVEYYMEKIEGVEQVTSGFTGGKTENPTYEDVLTETTGHYEAVRVKYNPKKVSFEKLAKTFLEIHDPTQSSGQGPDIGPQYKSAIFYKNDEQKAQAEKLLNILRDKGYKIATKLLPAKPFYKAENYHQNYYKNKGTRPYCHGYTKRF